jgi:hypothetical protein
MTGAHGQLAESWWGATHPATGPVGTSTTYVGQNLDFTADGRIFGFRAYRENGSGDSGWALFWNLSGALLKAIEFRDVSITGGDRWQNAWCHPTVRIDPAEHYFVVVLFSGGHYFRTNSIITGGGVTHGHIVFGDGFQTTNINPPRTTATSNTNANGVDVLFQAD